MHKLDGTEYGLRVTVEGFLDRAAMAPLCDDVEAYCRGAAAAEFGALFDLRRAAAGPVEAQESMKRCLQTLSAHGLGRHVVVVTGALATLQAKLLWREAGVAGWCRVLDASVTPAWEAPAVAWIENGLEPP
jgi:hypothetical protein